jgi:hypothetical protein
LSHAIEHGRVAVTRLSNLSDVDKPLTGVTAVQTLLRLNRIHPLKSQDDVHVLDFANQVTDDEQEGFRSALQDFVRFYSLIAQIVDWGDPDLERLYLYEITGQMCGLLSVVTFDLGHPHATTTRSLHTLLAQRPDLASGTLAALRNDLAEFCTHPSRTGTKGHP